MASPQTPLRLGTRASPLALAQADLVKHALCSALGWSSDAVNIVAMTSSGDRITDRSLAEIGGKALWTKELDLALLNGQIDCAVHSMKDVETFRPDALNIAAMLPRADVRDRLIGAPSIGALKQGAVIGTNSPRRTAQLKRLRPDLNFTLFRGNVATRLAKIEAGEADATLLAAAGLERLGLNNTGHAIEIEEMLPAPAQGAIGIEARRDDFETCALLGQIADRPTMDAVFAERAFLEGLNGNCHSPVAANASLRNGQLALAVELLLPDGSERLTDMRAIIDTDDARMLAREMLTKASPALRAMFD